MGMLKQGKIHYFEPPFGDLGDFGGGKGSPDGKYGKFYYSKFFIFINPKNFGVLNFFQMCTVWEIPCLAKNFKYGKRVEKGQSFHF
jgi:hypothetical protein